MIIRVIVATLCLLAARQCAAIDTSQRALLQGLRARGAAAADVFFIKDVCFVVRSNTMGEAGYSGGDLARALPPDVAAERGAIPQATQTLINQLYGHDQRPKLERTVLERDIGGTEFAWKVIWKLYPKGAFFMGSPEEYHAVLRADGSLCRPELFLCDWCRPRENPKVPPLYSCISMDDLLPTSAEDVAAEDVTRVAHAAIEKSLPPDVVKASNFTAGNPYRRTLPAPPSATDEHKAENDELEVWGVPFVRGERVPEFERGEIELVVWVTSDLKVGVLSSGHWQLPVSK
jgi:hypothetical protein